MDRSTAQEKEYAEQMEQHLQNLSKTVPLSYLVNNFAKYVRRQELSRFLVRHELYKRIITVKGSIIECGVFAGHGLMTWAQLAATLEPMGMWRKIYGFDTFAGFPNVSDKDLLGKQTRNAKTGDYKDECYLELQRSIELFDMNRFLSHLPKVHLIKGDFLQTVEPFMKDNPHLLISLLYLDFDLYEPTKKALELFLPRMPKGSILGFDEINNPDWPGETLALLDSLNIGQLRIEKMPHEPNMAFIVL
jgi:hypothetical protein